MEKLNFEIENDIIHFSVGSRNVIKLCEKFLLLVSLISLCSCAVNGRVVVRPDDVIAVASGRTQTQIQSGINIETERYQKCVSKGEYEKAIAHLEKINDHYKDIFYSEMDTRGAWRSPVMFTPRKIKQDGKIIHSPSIATQYLSNQHELARYALATINTDAYYYWLTKILTPEHKLAPVMAKIEESVKFSKLYETWLFTMNASRMYFVNGKIEESIKVLEIFSGFFNATINAYGSSENTNDLTWNDIKSATSCLLANYYLSIRDIHKASALLKNALSTVQNQQIKLRVLLLLSEIKRKGGETQFSSYYLSQAVSLADRKRNAHLDRTFFHAVSPLLIENHPASIKLVQIADRYTRSSDDKKPNASFEFLFIDRDPFLNAAYVYRKTGLAEKSEWCLKRFEAHHQFGYGEIEDTSDYARFLLSTQAWSKIQTVFLPKVDLLEYYRLKTMESRFSARSLKNLSTVYSALALSVLKIGKENLRDDVANWPAILGDSTDSACVVAFRITQLSKSRELLSATRFRNEDYNTISDQVGESMFLSICEKIAGKKRDWNIQSSIEQGYKKWLSAHPGSISRDIGSLGFLSPDNIGLKAGEAVFEIKVAGNHVMYFFLNGNTIQGGILNTAYKDLADLSRQFYELCRRPDTSGFGPVAKKLVLNLFGETLSELQDLDTLYIAPDLSFNALPVDAVFKNCGIHKLSKLDVIYTPSTYLLAAKIKIKQKVYGKAVALLGDPMPLDIKKTLINASPHEKQMLASFRGISVQNKTNLFLKSKMTNSAYDFSFVFSRIPYTTKEVRDIQKILSGAGIESNVFLTEQLTKPNVLAVMDQNPSILHFATHAIISNEIPYLMEPALVLSGSGRIINHFLLSSEIEKIDLSSTNLVVLSACQSGIDLNYDSEGVSGLAKSFLIAGTRNVILTLWSIDDKATSIFMTHFYKALLDGQTIRCALTEAKKNIAQQDRYKNPYFWAGFVLYGIG